MLGFNEIRKIENQRNEYKVKCSCGTKTVIPPFLKRLICRNCGHWFYRDKKQEFKDKMREKLKDGRR